MSELAFNLSHVDKTYLLDGGEVPILRDINLEIPSGQFISIMGPSGSGKSTLMNILGCLDYPTRGDVDVMGRRVNGLSDDQTAALRCKTLGFVFQAFNLLPCYDATSNVSLAMTYGGRSDRTVRARQLLESLGMGHRLHHRPQALSGGEKQRIAIARALANDPAILLADEPTGALDQANGRAVLDLLEGFHRQGRTIILVTHDAAVAAHAERIVQMVDGRINSDRFTRR